MQTTVKRAIPAGFVFGIIVTISLVVFADIKNFPGSACSANGANGDRDDFGVHEHWVWNGNASSDLDVICPILREESVDQTVDDLDVYVSDGHTSDQVGCRCYKVDANSSSYTYSSTAWSSYSGTGFQTLSPSCPSTSYTPTAFYNVWCTLPDIGTDSSRILGYEWNEL